MIAFYWDRMDHWFEEDEEVFVHPRDPYHRVDVIPTSRHIKISLDGEVLAETTSAMALFESNLPTRWYLPREDVSAELESTDTVTRCPYKGTASYYAVKRAERRERQGPDLVLRRSAPGGRPDRRAAVLLQRARRRRGRRRARGPARDHLEARGQVRGPGGRPQLRPSRRRS